MSLNVFVNVKSIGKRRPALRAVLYTLPGGVSTLRDLIAALVRIEAERYNSKESDTMLLPFLTEEQIEDQSVSGKVGFGRIYSDKKADPQKAIDTALQGFEDGLFRVTLGETEVRELDCPLPIKDGDTLTFIRLTFLSGRIW